VLGQQKSKEALERLGPEVVVDAAAAAVEGAAAAGAGGVDANTAELIRALAFKEAETERLAKALGRAVQVDGIKTRFESAYGFSAGRNNMMNRFQTLLSRSTCAATAGRQPGGMRASQGAGGGAQGEGGQRGHAGRACQMMPATSSSTMWTLVS